jgi:hypothetical protein
LVSRFSIMKRSSSRISAETKMRSLLNRATKSRSVDRSVGASRRVFRFLPRLVSLTASRIGFARNRISGITAGLGRLLSR